MKEIFVLHGLHKNIISYTYEKFTSGFWKHMFAGLGTQLGFNMTYHSQIDGQNEKVNIVLEGMLRIHVIH